MLSRPARGGFLLPGIPPARLNATTLLALESDGGGFELVVELLGAA
jgi:hypothetical protein